MRASRGGSAQFQRIVKQYFRSLSPASLLRRSPKDRPRASFDLATRNISAFHDRRHCLPFYQCPGFAHGERIRSLVCRILLAARRAAVLDFISAALFRERSNSEGERD